MIFSNVHQAYGDDSVFQVLVGCENHVSDGTLDSDWTKLNYDKIRAVKNSKGTYDVVIRKPDGELIFESTSVTCSRPYMAIEVGKLVYAKITAQKGN